MNKKRVALVVLAMILVCGLSVAGTVAYLNTRTNVVVNTFIAAGVDGPFVDVDENGNKMFELLEYKAVLAENGSGSYALDKTQEVNGNDYEVMPGTSIPKQPFVRLSRTYSKTVTKTDAEGNVEETKTYGPAPAYLFVEVCANALLKDQNVYTWSVKNDWTKLENVTGPNGGEVYVYGASGGTVLKTVNKNTQYDILTGNKITVDKDATAEQIGKEEIKMEFYAYLSQASVGESNDPAAVFKACFLN